MSTQDVVLCARCGGTHVGLEFKSFVEPIAPAELSPFSWTEWAPCPLTGEPILYGFSPAREHAPTGEPSSNLELSASRLMAYLDGDLISDAGPEDGGAVETDFFNELQDDLRDELVRIISGATTSHIKEK